MKSRAKTRLWGGRWLSSAPDAERDELFDRVARSHSGAGAHDSDNKNPAAFVRMRNMAF